MLLKFFFFLIFHHEVLGRARWTEDQANAWWSSQKRIIGSEFMASYAINQLEMFQADTFDVVSLDEEIELGQRLGFNTFRIFLHDLLYSNDTEGFKQRLNITIEICDKYGIKPTFVFFCGGKNVTVGKQPKPIPGFVSSGKKRNFHKHSKNFQGWAATPNMPTLLDPTKWPPLETYVKDIIGTFANDPRVLMWDLWNEPDAGKNTTEIEYLDRLFIQVFGWAQSVNPIQPLTSSVWRADFTQNVTEKNNPRERFTITEWLQVNYSDVISFHK